MLHGPAALGQNKESTLRSFCIMILYIVRRCFSIMIYHIYIYLYIIAPPLLGYIWWQDLNHITISNYQWPPDIVMIIIMIMTSGIEFEYLHFQSLHFLFFFITIFRSGWLSFLNCLSPLSNHQMGHFNSPWKMKLRFNRLQPKLAFSDLQ